MSKPKWILFDVGGVLLNWRKSSAALAETLGVTHDELLDTMFTYAPDMNVGTISPQEGWQKILDDLHSDMSPQSAIELWRAPQFWFVPSLELLRDLNKAGYKLAILSNSWLGLKCDGSDPTMPAELALFSHILDSSVEKMKKPNPAFYELAEKTVGASGSDLLFIDDDAPNLDPATARGWQVFHLDMVADEAELTASKTLRSSLL